MKHDSVSEDDENHAEPLDAGRRLAPVAFVGSIPASTWVPLCSGLLALGICCYQLSLPFVLLGIHGYSGSGYDDGVYLGAATRLVHGVLPYRDFDFVQPPGITLVMAPVALVGRLMGTRDAMGVARCVTAVVVGCNAALAALVMRRRGVTAMVVAGVSLAAFPLAVAADHTLLLEPYVVFLSLLGVVALFRDGELASSRRVLWAGVAFGFAGSIKLWAVLPAAAALVCCVPAWRRGVRPLIIGLVLGFAVACAPFAAFAPRAFVHDVITSQISRGTSGRGALSLAQRMLEITGLSGIPRITATTALAVGLGIGLGVLAVVVYGARWRRVSRLEWFALLAVVTAILGTFSSPEFYDHYAYFPAAFLALLLAVCAGQLVGWARNLAGHLDSHRVRIAATVASVVVVVAFAATLVFVVGQDTSYASSYLSSASDPAAQVDAQIPPGACVVYDYVIFGLNANRFNPTAPGCPAIVDPFGMWLSRDNGVPPPATPPIPPKFVTAWHSWFARADYVVQSIPYSNYIPWTPALGSYFNENFVLVSSQPRTFVYNHFDRTPTGAANAALQQGIAAFRQGRPNVARTEFESVIRIDPADTDGYFDLGVVDQRQGLDPAATAAYSRAFFLDPRSSAALFNLAVMDAPSSPPEAINLYRKILIIKPHDANTEFNLGLLLIGNGQKAQGDRLLTLAIHSNPALAAHVPAGITIP